ncbi:MAG: TetR/AcrR family transcriptional regulator [Lachnospiraceae bacterium]|nr:TetR/AcrR family transcriptional regulator [Lachnospiraceae bacterium]MBR3581238.1 TetR/AcrR family transcriptional regulator [Lachnospiraceae bacterium]
MPIRVFKEEEKESLKLKMLQAGFPLLQKYGMTHTSVAKITEAAGIAVGTFYHFFKNKEEYMYELIRFQRVNGIRRFVSPDILEGKRKVGRDEAKEFLKSMTDKRYSIYAYMTLQDEAALMSKLPNVTPDIGHEKLVAARLFSYLEGIRKDIDVALVANLIKLYVLAAQSRDILHPSGLEKTLDFMIESILDQIFE